MLSLQNRSRGHGNTTLRFFKNLSRLCQFYQWKGSSETLRLLQKVSSISFGPIKTSKRYRSKSWIDWSGNLQLFPVLSVIIYLLTFFLYKSFDKTNSNFVANLFSYYKRKKVMIDRRHLHTLGYSLKLSINTLIISQLSRPLNALDEIMTLMEANVKPRHNKQSLAGTGCGILPLASEFCHRLGGCHVIACNSGVHRYIVPPPPL